MTTPTRPTIAPTLANARTLAQRRKSKQTRDYNNKVLDAHLYMIERLTGRRLDPRELPPNPKYIKSLKLFMAWAQTWKE
jgi:hypothetical protein